MVNMKAENSNKSIRKCAVREGSPGPDVGGEASKRILVDLCFSESRSFRESRRNLNRLA